MTNRLTTDIAAEMRAVKEKYCELSPRVSPDELRPLHNQLKALRLELSAAITRGARPCPDCGQPPIGIMHDGANGPEYEVGCAACKDHRGERSRSRAAAVAAWDDGPDSWVKPKRETMVIGPEDVGEIEASELVERAPVG